jgi:hypothetical protein
MSADEARHIEADIAALEEFAARLADEVEQDYAPDAVTVSDSLLTRLPAADVNFTELCLFVHAHEQAQDATQQNVYNYANGTYRLAVAAREAGAAYRAADIAARDRVTGAPPMSGVPR